MRTRLKIILIAMIFSSCIQHDHASAQKIGKAVIKSEKIIYYDIGLLKNEKSYGFGRDVFNEYDSTGNSLKESIIMFEEETGKETINLASLFHYQKGKLSKVENYSVLRGGIKREEIILTYQTDGKRVKEE